MSDNLLMLLEMIEEVLEEQALISESTDGFAFERVIVDVAKFGSEAVKQGASTSGTAEWNKIPSSMSENLLASSIRALKQMGYDEEKIKGNDARGVDREASGFSTRGLDIRGMPKTDVIIKDKDGNRWKISLKLSGDIQIGGAGPLTTIEILSKTLSEFGTEIEKIEKDLEAKARNELQLLLQTQLDQLTELLKDSAGIYYPKDNFVESLTAKLMKDIQKKPEKMKERNITNEAEARTYAKQIQKEFIDRGLGDWKEWNLNVKGKLVEALKKFLTDNDDFFAFVIDEYLTGRRQFAEEGKEAAIANAYLSPDKWVTLETIDNTKEFLAANQGAFKLALDVDTRGRGRPNLSKEVSVKIEFKAKKYGEILEQLAQAAVIQGGCKNTSAPATMQEEASECQIPETIAKKLSEKAEIEVDVDEGDIKVDLLFNPQ